MMDLCDNMLKASQLQQEY